MISVIVLLGILGIVALGRFTDQNLFVARGVFDDTVTAGAAMRVDITVSHAAIADILLSGYRTRYP